MTFIHRILLQTCAFPFEICCVLHMMYMITLDIHQNKAWFRRFLAKHSPRENRQAAKNNAGGRFIFNEAEKYMAPLVIVSLITQRFVVRSASATELNYMLRLFVFAGCKRLGCVSSER